MTILKSLAVEEVDKSTGEFQKQHFLLFGSFNWNWGLKIESNQLTRPSF